MLLLRYSDVPRIWAVAGKRADLPCPSNPRKAGDRALLVLWYRESTNKPVYSYDARAGNFSSGERWSNKTMFGERAYFVPLANPPALILEPVMPHDEGLYTCRHDYMDSPTTSSFTRLSVLIFPTPPEILWNGHRVFGPIGPLKEGSFHKLTCLTQGGRPLPSLVWWLEGHRAMNQIQKKGDDGEMRSILTVKASREINMKSLTCHAQIRQGTAPIAQPLTASVRLNITLPPLGITIQGGELSVAVDTTLSLVCHSWGSHPPAMLAWWKSGKKMKSYSYSIKDGGNLTTSEIKVVVDTMDHGATFTCRSSNALLGGLPLVAGRRLNVTYKPIVELRLKVSNKFISTSKIISAKIRSVTVKQGSNVRLECSSDANPVPDYIEWHQNGVIIDAGKEAWSLLLERVMKEKSGLYSCSATNQAGRGVSAAYNIIVEHAPQCSSGWQKRTQGTEIGRSVTVLCRVEALPSHDISFTWSKISDQTGETEFNQNQIQTDGITSRITVTPRSLKDFGTLLCRASNRVGVQEIPCKVTLVPASPPDPPFNCSTDTGNTAGSLSITCSEGFDGGFPQKFILVAIQKGKIGANITRDFPEWLIQNLEYGKSVTLRIYGFNARGRSESVRLEVFIPVPEIMSDQDTKENDENVSFNHRATLPLIGILVGVGAVLVIASIVILSFFCSSRRRFFSWLTKTPSRSSSSANQQHSHTFVFSSSNVARGEDSEASLSKGRLIPDPDIVTCIQYGSRTSSSKGLDVIPSRNQVHHPLVNTPDQHSDLNAYSCSSLSMISSQNSVTQGYEYFEREELKDPTIDGSVFAYNVNEKMFTDGNYLSEKDSESSKGAIPKRLYKEDERSSLSRSKGSNYDMKYDSFSRRDIPTKTFVPLPLETIPASYSNALYSYNTGACNQCYAHSGNSQGQHSLLANNNAVDSLTYSNACCVEHYGPYYVYKHVKCYPHKTYKQCDGFSINDQQPSDYCGYFPPNVSFQDPNGQPSINTDKDEVSKLYSDQHEESIYEESRQRHPLQLDKSRPEVDLKKSEKWSNNCGNFICGGSRKNDSMERRNISKQRIPLAVDNHFSTYRKFDGVYPGEITLNLINPKNKDVKKQKVPFDFKTEDFRKLKAQGRARITTSLSEENLKQFNKHKPETRFLSSSNLYQSNKDAVYGALLKDIRNRKQTDKLKSAKVTTKSSFRLKEVGSSQLCKSKEIKKLQNLEKEESIASKVPKINKDEKTKRKLENDEEKEELIANKKDLERDKKSENVSDKESNENLASNQPSYSKCSTEPQVLASTLEKMEEKDDAIATEKSTESINKTNIHSRKTSKHSKGVTMSMPEVKMATLKPEVSPKVDKNRGQQPLPLKSILRNSKQ